MGCGGGITTSGERFHRVSLRMGHGILGPMSAKKTKTRAKPAEEDKKSEAEQPNPPVPYGYRDIDPLKPDPRIVSAVCLVARRLDLEGRSVDAMMKSWLGVVERDGGKGTAMRIVNFLGGMLEGKRSGPLIKACGLTWGTVAMLMDGCEEFKKMFLDVRRIRKEVVQMEKESLGESVLDTAFELATEGAEQYSMKDGTNLGFKRKSEKMLDRLLVLSGQEFRKDVGVPASGAMVPGAAGGGITLNFHFDGKGAPSITTGETVDV